jgi:hypothetical protein
MILIVLIFPDRDEPLFAARGAGIAEYRRERMQTAALTLPPVGELVVKNRGARHADHRRVTTDCPLTPLLPL